MTRRPRRGPLLATLLSLPTSFAMADGLSVGIGGGGGGITVTLPPCDLDTSWGAEGAYTLADRSVTATLVDRQGRLLLAGSTATGSYVRRLLATGAIDTGFASGGTLALSHGDGATRDRPVALALGPGDDVFLVVNHDKATAANTAPSYSLLHVLAGGSIDSSFGGGAITGTGEARTFYRNTYGSVEVLLTPAPGQWGLREYSGAGALNTALGNNGLHAEDGTLLGRAGPMPGNRVDVFYDCRDDVCGYWRSSFSAGSVPAAELISAFPTLAIQTLSMPNALSIDGILTLIGTSSLTVPIEGTDTDVTPVDPAAGAVYPDGFVSVFGHDTLQMAKRLGDLSADTGFCGGNHERTGLSTGVRVGVQLAIDAGGHLLLSSSEGEYHAPYLDYALSAEVSRFRGSAPDTSPADLVALPRQDYDTITQLSTMQAITVQGLGAGVSVPARIVPLGAASGHGWELSIDDGVTWYDGWLWVRNGTRLMARRPGSGSAAVTVGGVLSPNSPGVPVGTVLSVGLTPTAVAVVNPSGSTLTEPAPAQDSGGSGGAFGLPLLLGLGLAAWQRRRR